MPPARRSFLALALLGLAASSVAHVAIGYYTLAAVRLYGQGQLAEEGG